MLHSPQKKVVKKVIEKSGKKVFLKNKVVKIYQFLEKKIARLRRAKFDLNSDKTRAGRMEPRSVFFF